MHVRVDNMTHRNKMQDNSTKGWGEWKWSVMSVKSEQARSYDEGINCRNENTLKRHFWDKKDND